MKQIGFYNYLLKISERHTSGFLFLNKKNLAVDNKVSCDITRQVK